MPSSLQFLASVCYISFGLCVEDVALLQDVEIRSHVDDAPKEQQSSAIRQMLKNSQMPGLADKLPANMPEIDMGEVMGLLDLLPVLIKGVSDELPKVVRTARTMEYMSTRRARTLEAGDNASEDILKERILSLVANYKDAWLPFATALVEGLNNAIVPIIRTAQTRVSFIPENATEQLVSLVTGLINHTAMSGLAQLPLKSSLSTINERAFFYWNATNSTMDFLSGLLVQDGGVLDSVSMLPIPTPGVNLTQVVQTLKPQAVQIVESVKASNDAVGFAIHNVSKRLGVDWRTTPAPAEEGSESGSVCVRAGLAFVLASAFALLRF